MTLTDLTRWPLAVLRYSEAYGDAEVRAFLADMAALLGRGEPFALAIVMHPAQFGRSLSPEVSRAYALGVKANREAMAARCRGLAFVVADEGAREAYAAKVQGNGRKVFGTPMRVFATEAEAGAWLEGCLAPTLLKGTPMKHALFALLLTALAFASAQRTTCEAGFRLFDHDLLATEPLCIPENRERIALVDTAAITAYSLGVETVTMNWYFNDFAETYPFALDAEALGRMVDIGYAGEANVEAVLSARPDLIISATYWEQFNAAFARIAPTVVFDYELATSWLQGEKAVAEVLGRTEEQEALLAELDARVQTLRELLQDAASEKTYTVFRTTDARDNLQVFTTLNFGAQLAQEVGLTMADAIATPEEAARVNRPYWYPLSLERLTDLEAAHVFFLPGWEADTQEAFLTNPLWGRLDAVQEGRVHFIGGTGEHWIRENVINAHRVLDDLFLHLAEVDPAEVSPNPFAYLYQQAETQE